MAGEKKAACDAFYGVSMPYPVSACLRLAGNTRAVAALVNDRRAQLTLSRFLFSIGNNAISHYQNEGETMAISKARRRELIRESELEEAGIDQAKRGDHYNTNVGSPTNNAKEEDIKENAYKEHRRRIRDVHDTANYNPGAQGEDIPEWWE